MGQRLIRTLTVVMIAAVLSSCAPSEIISSSQSSSDFSSQSISASEKPPATRIDEITAEDVPDMSAVYNTEKLNELIALAETVDVGDIGALCDNSRALGEIIKENGAPLSPEVTFQQSALWSTPVSPTNGELSDIIALTGADIGFVRSTGTEFYDERYKEQAQRMYTVFDSEMGGRVFCFFNYYPATNATAYSASAYVVNSLCHDDLSSITVGDSIDKLIEIYRPAILAKTNTVYWRVIVLLSDGVQFFKTKYIPETQTSVIDEIFYSESYILPNVCVQYPEYEAVTQGTYPAEVSYDFTILPQDYPPAQ